MAAVAVAVAAASTSQGTGGEQSNIRKEGKQGALSHRSMQPLPRGEQQCRQCFDQSRG